MSSQESRRTVRNTRQRKIVLDLNVPPPTENREQEGTSAHAWSQGGPSAQQRGSMPPPIDLEAIDDDVTISSPRAFEQAKNNSSRTRGGTVVFDVDSGQSSRVSPNNRVKRRRVHSNQTIMNCHLYINLEGSSSAVSENVRSVTMPPPAPPPPPPKEPTFSCPVCMGPLVEEMSTKCGHIFCKACIKASIAAQSKCPTCRRKITMKDTIRVYLPTAS